MPRTLQARDRDMSNQRKNKKPPKYSTLLRSVIDATHIVSLIFSHM